MWYLTWQLTRRSRTKRNNLEHFTTKNVNLLAQKSIRFLVIGRLQNRCGDALFFLFFYANREIRVACIRGDQISHIQSMVAKRGLTNRANVHTSMSKKSFKTQHGRNPIDPAILAAIGHRFIANKKKRQLKMPTHGSEATSAETSKICDTLYIFISY